MSSPRRLVPLLTLVLALPLGLAACTQTTIPLEVAASSSPESPATGSSSESSSPKEPRPSGSSEPAPSASSDLDREDVPDNLSFEAGADLDQRFMPQWGDSMLADEGFAVASPDNGNGGWSYTHLASKCTVAFWQGNVGDLPPVEDDRALSDEVLAYYFDDTAESVTPYAVDDSLPLHIDRSGEFEVRTVRGARSESGEEYLVSARGIAGLKAGYLLSVTCAPGQDPKVARDQFRDTHLSLIVLPKA